MEKEFLINAGPLSNCIKKLLPFISKDTNRFYLNGIYFEIKADSEELNMVATDGIKLCVLEAHVDRQVLWDNEALAAIVPTKALATILAMLKGVNGDCPIALRFDERRLFVDTPEEKGEFLLIDGSYPDFRKVIPTKKPKFTIGLGKAQAKEAMKAIASQTKEGLLWEMTDNTSPLVIRADGTLVVVMPMRVTLPGEQIVGDPMAETNDEEDESDE